MLYKHIHTYIENIEPLHLIFHRLASIIGSIQLKILESDETEKRDLKNKKKKYTWEILPGFTTIKN